MHVVKANTPRIKRYLKRIWHAYTQAVRTRVKTKCEIIKGDRREVGSLIPITAHVPTLEDVIRKCNSKVVSRITKHESKLSEPTGLSRETLENDDDFPFIVYSRASVKGRGPLA